MVLGCVRTTLVSLDGNVIFCKWNNEKIWPLRTCIKKPPLTKRQAWAKNPNWDVFRLYFLSEEATNIQK